MRAWTTLAASALLMGCSAEPQQWLVSVATDAPLPHFGDHLVLEALGVNASCTGCLRLIGVDHPEDFPVSFGVVPQVAGATVRVRARLYRAAQAGPDGLPAEGAALIDAIGELPPLVGETRVVLNLFMGCFGVSSASDQSATCDPATGALGAVPVLSGDTAQPAAGSWSNAGTIQCNDASVPDGMVCVPGGAFILGTPQPTYVVDDAQQTQPEHLVQLSPFAMDIDEVTVGAVVDLVKSKQLTSLPIAKDTSDPTTQAAACTYVAGATAAERALPINCVTRKQAEDICAALGNKRLPTEAEWEYAAGNLGEETQYPWGAGDVGGDPCSNAIIGRGRMNAEGDDAVDLVENSACRMSGSPPWGPVAGGNPADITTQGIKNLAGNMTEWVADDFAPYTDPCWQPQQGTLLVNPVCQVSTGTFSWRGSSWAGPEIEAPATARDTATSEAGNPYTGFRCVVSM
jgi:sulfatase modifying factor 1